jgi:hypothetical protein
MRHLISGSSQEVLAEISPGKNKARLPTAKTGLCSVANTTVATGKTLARAMVDLRGFRT